MNTQAVEYIEFGFRIGGVAEEPNVKFVEFKVLAMNFPAAITQASKFAREHKLVPSHYTLCWRADRHVANAFVYTGLPKYSD
jgi:hypothetical protein